MIGIYKIENLITGDFYIGASVNIHRRFMEHKTPNAYGNDRLHGDMKKYGKENFSFTVIEECKKEELSNREMFYIHSMSPSYNVVGMPKSEEAKKKVSDGAKRWWRELPKETRDKIISNNLMRPRLGREVKPETREKLRKAAIQQLSRPIRCIETGEVYPSQKDFEQVIGAYSGCCSQYFAGKIKSVKGFHIERV